MPPLPKRPVVKTEKPNGKGPRTYSFYLFVPSKDIPVKRWQSAADDLSGSHPTIGDLWLVTGAKLIGYSDVRSWAFQYVDDDASLRLVATSDGKKWHTLGYANPE